ncbi:MAG TPA: hypothetical protein VFR09_06930 [Alphaproteobacteria bacterium]|nr:hypothetical protein [Alphaproteobacteria bacterium]
MTDETSRVDEGKALLKRLERNLLRRGRSTLSDQDVVQLFNNLTNRAIVISGAEAPNTELLELCHTNLSVLHRKWPLRPEETENYLTQLLKAHNEVAPPMQAEIRDLLWMLESHQDRAETRAAARTRAPKLDGLGL